MRPIVRICCAALIATLAVPAPAQTAAINAARGAAAVGERYDGYLGLAATVPAEVARQVSAVNIRRRALYTGLASRRNVTVDAVAIAAGCELLARVDAGEAYMLSDGVWRTRAPGGPAPVPPYCAP